jgi:uncharacterized protein YqhQ
MSLPLVLLGFVYICQVAKSVEIVQRYGCPIHVFKVTAYRKFAIVFPEKILSQLAKLHYPMNSSFSLYLPIQ